MTRHLPDQRRDDGSQLAACVAPPVSPPSPGPRVADCFRRISTRRAFDEIIGMRVWLPRLGASVLVHGRVGEMKCACTLVARDDGSPRLPVGVMVLSTVEVGAGVLLEQDVVPALSNAEFGSAWRVRLADRGLPSRLVQALIEAATPTVPSPHSGRQLRVDLNERRVLLRSGCRTRTGFDRHCADLVEMGAVRLLPNVGDRRRAELVLPPPVWSW